MTASVDEQSTPLPLSQEGSKDARRNLKTAGGVGLVNIQNELLDKGIVYKASIDRGVNL